jgi:hypothetical protein
MAKFKCKRCGECCKHTPCIMSQIKYGTTKENPVCPSLTENAGLYSYSLIETDQEAREAMLDGVCSHPSKPGKKFTPAKIVKEFFPEATKDEIDCILWNETSFPCFWNFGTDGWTPSQCLRKQLGDLRTRQQEGSL